VEFRSEADGMTWLSVYGPGIDLTAVKVMLDAAAAAVQADDPDDPRTRDQIRVDVLTQLAWGILEDGHLPDHPDAADTHDCRADGGDQTASTNAGADTDGVGCAQDNAWKVIARIRRTPVATRAARPPPAVRMTGANGAASSGGDWPAGAVRPRRST
jgi:Domain of unknown function (DUF222)